jgi:hypothetical protein
MKGGSVVDRATTLTVLRAAGIEPPKDMRRLMRCLFHDDSTPSLRIFERGFVCFGCGTRGGVLDFTVELGLASDRGEAARLLKELLP